MTHLFDSSAIFAHYFQEPGREVVQELIENPEHEVGISVLTLYEFDRRLVEFALEKAERDAAISDYLACLDEVFAVDQEVCAAASSLRASASRRISAVDILIAATAAVHSAPLVHRDAHFAAIPAELLRQEYIG